LQKLLGQGYAGIIRARLCGFFRVGLRKMLAQGYAGVYWEGLLHASAAWRGLGGSQKNAQGARFNLPVKSGIIRRFARLIILIFHFIVVSDKILFSFETDRSGSFGAQGDFRPFYDRIGKQ